MQPLPFTATYQKTTFFLMPKLLPSPPASLEAERAALRRAILDEDSGFLTQLEQGDFTENLYWQIIEAAQVSWEEYEACDPLATDENLTKNSKYQELGGLTWLTKTILDAQVSCPKFLLKTLRKYRAQRETGKLYLDLEKGDMNKVPDLLTEHSQYINDILSIDEMDSIDNIVEEFQKDHDHVPTGIEGLDEALNGGFRTGSLNVIGARPGIGKTSLAATIAANLLARGLSFNFISIEMDLNEILSKILCALTRMKHDSVSEEIRGLLEEYEGKLLINDRIDSISAIKQAIMASEQDLIIIDYYQLITTKLQESRTFQLDEISREIRLAAKRSGKPVLLLSQLNRKIEEDKKGREPILADLKGSGTLEQDAHMVAFLFDPDKGLEMSEAAAKVVSDLEGTNDSTIELIVRKNRGGPKPRLSLKFQWEISLMTQTIG